MDPIAFILFAALSGIVVGAIARLIIPGRDPMSIPQTMLVGVAGSLIAALITYYLFDREAAPGLLLSIVCAAVLVFAIRKFRERQGGAAPAAGGMAGSPFGSGQMTTGVRFMPGCLVTSLLLSVFLTVFLNLLLRAF